MTYTLDLQQKPSQNVLQLQHLIMSRKMQQAIHLLQMPITELSLAVEEELQHNPLLEYPDEKYEDTQIQQLQEESAEDVETDIKSEVELKFDEHDFETLLRLDEEFRDAFSESGNFREQRTKEQEKNQNYLENSICAETSLFEYLMQQAQETLNNKIDITLAEAIIGNFDENGFLTTSLQEIALMQGCQINTLEKILNQIQQFDPAGIGARSLQESLLIQLRRQQKQKTLAYEIIEKCFDDLLHNRIPNIRKTLHCTSEEIGGMIDSHIAKLDLHPGVWLSRNIPIAIIPDVSIREDDGKLEVVINDEFFPPLRLNKRYLKMLKDENLPRDIKEFIQQKLVSAKWLMRNILQRNSTIEKIAYELTKSQKTFFLYPDGKLQPLTMKIISEELKLHESTVARAISDKYIDTPRGIFPLRFFFTNAIETHAGETLSSRTVKDLIKEMIAHEDKSHPLSDEALSHLMTAKGIKCARRTVAKYRIAMGLGTAQQRKKFSSPPI